MGSVDIPKEAREKLKKQVAPKADDPFNAAFDQAVNGKQKPVVTTTPTTTKQQPAANDFNSIFDNALKKKETSGSGLGTGLEATSPSTLKDGQSNTQIKNEAPEGALQHDSGGVWIKKNGKWVAVRANPWNKIGDIDEEGFDKYWKGNMAVTDSKNNQWEYDPEDDKFIPTGSNKSEEAIPNGSKGYNELKKKLPATTKPNVGQSNTTADLMPSEDDKRFHDLITNTKNKRYSDLYGKLWVGNGGTLSEIKEFNELNKKHGLKDYDILESSATDAFNKEDVLNYINKRFPKQALTPEQQKKQSLTAIQQAVNRTPTITAVEKKPIPTKKDIEEEAANNIVEGRSGFNPQSEDPLGDMMKKKNADLNEKSIDDFFEGKWKEHSDDDVVKNQEIDFVKDLLYNNGDEAGVTLQEYANKKNGGDISKLSDGEVMKLAEGNETMKVAAEKYTNLRDLQTTIAGARNFDDAATTYMQNRYDKELGGQIKYLRKEGGGTNVLLNEPLKGQIMFDFLSDKNLQYLKDKDPKVNAEYTKALYNFPNQYPDQAEKLLSEMIADEREKTGMNNFFANVVGKESTDKIVDDLIARGDLPPNYKAIYTERIRPSLGTGNAIGRGIGNLIPGLQQFVNDSKIPTPGFVENTEEGFENTMTGTAKSIATFSHARQVYSNESDRINSALEKQLTTRAFEPQGLGHKASAVGGHLTGFVLGLSPGSTALKGYGLLKNVQAANAMAMGAAVYGDYADRAKQMFPGQSIKQYLYTDVMTALNMAGAKYLPGTQINKMLQKQEGAIMEVIDKAAGSKISTDFAISKIKDKAMPIILDAIKKTAKGNLGAGEFMAANTFIDQTLSQALKGEHLQIGNNSVEAMKQFGLGFLGATFISAAGAGLDAHAEFRGVRNQIYDIASHPQDYKDALDIAAQLDQSVLKAKPDILDNLNIISSVKKQLDSETSLSDKQKKSYVVKSLQEHALEKRIAELTEPELKKPLQEKLKVIQEGKKKIFEPIKEVNDEFKERIAAAETQEEKDAIMQEHADNLTAQTQMSEGDKLRIQANELQMQANMLPPEEMEKKNEMWAEADKLRRQADETGLTPEDKDLLSRVREKASFKDMGLQYYIDKAGEDPTQAAKDYGQDVADELLKKVSTETLQANLEKSIELGATDSADAIGREIDRREAAATPTTKTEPTVSEPLKDVVDDNLKEVKSALDGYENSKNTEADIADIVENLDIPELKDAVNKFREEQEYDRGLAGRGDMDSANDALMAAVENYVKEKSQSSNPSSKTVSEVGDVVPKIGKFEAKARALAERINNTELPSWLKADLPEGTQKQGVGADDVKKALAAATIEMGKLLDKGIEFKDAVRGAVKDLVDMIGEHARDRIENGFAEDYKRDTEDVKKSGVSVIMPSENKSNVIPLKKAESETTETTPEGTEQIPTEEGGGKEEPVTENVPAAEDKPPISDQPQGTTIHFEHPQTELSMRGLQVLANEFGLENVESRDKKSDLELMRDAEQTVNDWAANGVYAKNIEELVRRSENDGTLNDEERVILEQHVANLAQKLRGLKSTRDPQYDEILAEAKRVKDAGEKARQAAGAALRIPIYRARPRNILDAFVEEMEATKQNKLTDEQKENVKKEWEDLEKAKEDFEKYKADREREMATKDATSAFEKARKSSPREKKSHDDFVAERSRHVDNIKDKLKKFKMGGGPLSAVPLPYIPQLIAIAPDVAKIMLSYAKEEGASFLDFVDDVHNMLKSEIKGITHDDVIAMAAGRYNEKKETNNELKEKIYDWRKEARLLDKLNQLNAGDLPMTDKKERRINKALAKLEKEYKNHPLLKATQDRMRDEKKISELKGRLKDLEDGTNPVKREKRVREVNEEIADLQKQIKEHPTTKAAENEAQVKKLQERLADLDAGVEPVKAEAKKKEVSAEVEDLRKQIKEHPLTKEVEQRHRDAKRIEDLEQQLSDLDDGVVPEKREKKKAEVNEKIKELQQQVKDHPTTKKAENEEQIKKLQDRLANLDAGIEPEKVERKKKEVSAEVADLRKQVKEHPLTKEIAKRESDEKRIADLEQKLADLDAGIEPDLRKKAKAAVNKEIEDLQKKIKEHPVQEAAEFKQRNEELTKKLTQQLADLDAGKEPAKKKREAKAVTEEVTNLRKQVREHETTRLANAKASLQRRIDKVQAELDARKAGTYEEPKKLPKPTLDKTGQDLQDKLMKLENERELRLLIEAHKSMTGVQKTIHYAADILNVPRSLMTMGDYSAMMRQGLIPTIAHPGMAFGVHRGEDGKLKWDGAFYRMFKAGVSQKAYDRWFHNLREEQRYDIMRDTKLAISDNISHELTAREEEFMSTLAEKFPIIGQTLNIKVGGKNIKIPGTNLVKGSERAYTMYLNKMRVDLFNMYAGIMEKDGRTYRNSPEQYKQMAQYVNNVTGRGTLGRLERVGPLLNGALFSPKLISSRFNMLTYWAQPRFYQKAPVEVRKAYFADMAKFVTAGVMTLGLMKLWGNDVESDPRSTDFGKIKQGNTRWDIWGGFQPYARASAQALSGWRKTEKGDIVPLGNDKPFQVSEGDVWLGLLRSKLSPVLGAYVDIKSGKTMIGEKIIYHGKAGDKEISIKDYIIEHMIPLTASGTMEAMKDQGAKAIATVGIPNMLGINTQTYNSPKPKIRKNAIGHKQ